MQSIHLQHAETYSYLVALQRNLAHSTETLLDLLRAADLILFIPANPAMPAANPPSDPPPTPEQEKLAAELKHLFARTDDLAAEAAQQRARIDKSFPFTVRPQVCCDVVRGLQLLVSDQASFVVRAFPSTVRPQVYVCCDMVGGLQLLVSDQIPSL